jgi:carboxyl-terminal processing protease
MGSKLKSLGLISFGVVAGVAASLQYSALAQKINAIPLPLEKLSEFSEVFGMIKSDYVEPVDDEKLLNEAINGMVNALDPHSAYLDKKSFKELREGTEGKFIGLGIEVGMEDGYVKVVSPIEDSPASRAGIQPSDLITRIDGVPIKGLSIDDAVKKMRGEPNTKITLTIARKTEDKPIVVTLTRELIKQHSVKGKLVEPGRRRICRMSVESKVSDRITTRFRAIRNHIRESSRWLPLSGSAFGTPRKFSDIF